MIERRHWEILYKAILLTMVFLLASEPVLVAAKPQEVDPRQEAVNALAASGDLYLTNAAQAVSLSADLAKSVAAIQNTSLPQISENAVLQARTSALQVAESSAIALGSIDDLATSIESFGSNVPVAFDPFERAAQGLPQQFREDLIQQASLSSTDVDAISSGMDDILLERQSMAANGMPAEMAAQLSQAGFTQAEIDQIATVAGTRGLANTSLTTALAQFRASRDEWADVRTQYLILNVQLIGYQIGVRQANGIQSRAVTDAELQEITDDELRLLVHVAHLQALWGSDPSLEVGEGDWWFIEHYAGRAAERLDTLVIESQNRGLIQDLFVLQEMRLLALSAKNGDAQYVKAELDGLGKLLSYLVGDETFVSRQRNETRGLGYVAARLASHPKLREKVQWHVDGEARSGAAKNARVRMDELGVQSLAPLSGFITELNESNNAMAISFLAGMSPVDQATAAILREIMSIAVGINQMQLVDLIKAILTGDTDNPLLITTNMVLGFIPVISVITDIFALVVTDHIFMKAILLFALFADIGETVALIPGLQAALVSYIGGGITAVVKVLFASADEVFKGFLRFSKLAQAFDLVVDFVRVASSYITTAIHSVEEAIQVLQGILSGGFKVWDSFVAFVKRVGTQLLLDLGFDQGSLLVGRMLDQGVTLGEHALMPAKNVADDLAKAGVDLGDDAAKGTGELIATTESESKTRAYLAGAACLLSAGAMAPVGHAKSARPLHIPLLPAKTLECEAAGKLIKNLGLNVKILSENTLNQIGKLLNATMQNYGEEYVSALLRDLYKSQDAKFDEQVYTLISNLLKDPDLMKLVAPTVNPAIRDGVVTLLRKISHPKFRYWGKPGLSYQLSRIKSYFNEGTLKAVEQFEITDDGAEMYLDFVIRRNGKDLPVEVKYWRWTTIDTSCKSIVKQMQTRLQNYDQVVLELGTTLTKPISGFEDPAVQKLIKALTDAGLTVSTDFNSPSAKVLLQFP